MTDDLLDRLTTQAITIEVGSDTITLRCPSPGDYIDIIDFAKARDAETGDGAYAFKVDRNVSGGHGVRCEGAHH